MKDKFLYELILVTGIGLELFSEKSLKLKFLIGHISKIYMNNKANIFGIKI